MVKFSKQFEGQLVPEWKEAFVDYWQLKKDLKKIHLLDNHHKALDTGKPSSLAQTATRFFSPFKQLSVWGHDHRDHGLIQAMITSAYLIIRKPKRALSITR
ncbi:hypothetical protein ACLOJK_032653 [Asimina triloba]